MSYEIQAFDEVLTNHASSYSPKDNQFIAEEVLPVFNADGINFKKQKFDRSTEEERTLVGPYGESNSSQRKGEFINESCEIHKWETFIPLSQSDQPGYERQRMESAINSTHIVARGKERSVRDLTFTASNYKSGNSNPVVTADKFGADGAKPIKYITERVEKSDGGNIIVCSYNVFWVLAGRSDIREAVYGTASGQKMPTGADLAPIFGVDKFIVGSARGSSGNRIWADHMAILNSNLSGANFAELWKYTPEIGVRAEIDTRKGGKSGVEIITAYDCYKAFVVFNDLGYLMTDCV